MVFCRKCKNCIDDEVELKIMGCIYCYACDDYIDNKAAEDDLECEWYDEKLDDNETEKSSA